MTDQSPAPHSSPALFLRNVLIKAALLFLVLNFAVALVPRESVLSRLTVYNHLLPGRIRLPFGENPGEAYNLSLYDLEAMFASHEISQGEKPEDEFRVVLIGDSASWGILLEPEHTLSQHINQDDLISCDGRRVQVYNLAYPTLSLTKDLLILEKALTYAPDLILWPVTLQSFPRHLQIETPLVANNPARARSLIEELDLNLPLESADFVDPTLWDRTLIGRRRALFDHFQLQAYGLLWAATGVDQTYPPDYTPAQRDFDPDDTQFQGWDLIQLGEDQLSLEMLNAGAELAGDIPILVINEPILVSTGENSDLRYNFFYPRWAYDQYRQMMTDQSAHAAWSYLDVWNVVPESEFTNSAVHLTPAGSAQYYQAIKPALLNAICP